MDLVMTKWIALEGTVYLAEQRREALIQRFSRSMLRDAASFREYLSIEKEKELAMKAGAAAVHPLGYGGIFNGLWNMAEELGVGLEVDLKRIPIRQETVEFCEFFGLNPYYLASKGALLIQTPDGLRTAWKLQHEGIEAAVIGQTTNGNDRIIFRDESRRYLDRPQKEELEKLEEIS